MIWTIVCFFIALFVLKRYAFGPIQGMLDKRQETIADSIKAAEDARDESLKLLEQHKQLIGEALLLNRHEVLELLRDLLDLARAALLRRHPEEVGEQRLGVAGEICEELRLHAGVELRVAEDGTNRVRVRRHGREVGQRLVHGREAAGVLRRAEESFGVDAVRDCHAG